MKHKLYRTLPLLTLVVAACAAPLDETATGAEQKASQSQSPDRAPAIGRSHPEAVNLRGYTRDGKLGHPCSALHLGQCVLTADHCVKDKFPLHRKDKTKVEIEVVSTYAVNVRGERARLDMAARVPLTVNPNESYSGGTAGDDLVVFRLLDPLEGGATEAVLASELLPEPSGWLRRDPNLDVWQVVDPKDPKHRLSLSTAELSRRMERLFPNANIWGWRIKDPPRPSIEVRGSDLPLGESLWMVGFGDDPAVLPTSDDSRFAAPHRREVRYRGYADAFPYDFGTPGKKFTIMDKTFLTDKPIMLFGDSGGPIGVGSKVLGLAYGSSGGFDIWISIPHNRDRIVKALRKLDCRAQGK
jgi:hypothetical protein